MEQNKDLKDNQFAFIFNYDNFINKSSQQRYYELKTEVKDKLDRIKDEVNIAGASEKEKKYNLLMHYKQLLEGLDYSKEGKKDNFQILSSYIMITAMIMVAWLPYALSFLKKENGNANIIYMCSVVIVIIMLGGFAYISAYFKSKRRKDIEVERQKYLYCKFYYNELKKYNFSESQ